MQELEITTETTKKSTVKVSLYPCPKCKKGKLIPYDCGYSSFNVCGIKCSCGYSMSRNGDWDVKSLVSEWNKQHKPKKNKDDIIEILRLQITRMGKVPEA